MADTSAPVIAGTITLASLKVTDKPLDLAIQGHGFFALRLPNRKDALSRNGEMSLDARGILIHTLTKAQVLGYCGKETGPIDLSRFARDSADGAASRF